MDEITQISETQETSTLPKKITKRELYELATTRKSIVLTYIKTVCFLLLSSFLVSFAAYSLIRPNNFTIGGVSGIAILVNAETGIPQSIIGFCLNTPLVILSFFFVKKRFAVITTLHIGLQTLWMVLLEQLFPDFIIQFEQDAEKIFAALAAGLCIGTAIALAFKIGGSTGGADIVAVMLQKKISASSLAWILFFVNFVVVASSLFVFYDAQDTLAYNLLPIILSTFELYIESKTNSSLTEGLQSAIEFRIITEKPEEISRALMRELSRGVTSIPAMGMYTKINRSMLYCVVSRRQVATLKKIIKSIDPDSFAVMANVSQVLGLGFYTSEL